MAAKGLCPHGPCRDLHRPAKVVFLRPSTKEGLSPFACLPFWKKVVLCAPGFRIGTHCSLPVLHLHHLKVFCMRDLSVFPCLFIYSVIYLYQYGVNRYFNLWFRVQYCVIYPQLVLENNLELQHIYIYIYIYIYIRHIYILYVIYFDLIICIIYFDVN